MKVRVPTEFEKASVIKNPDFVIYAAFKVKKMVGDTCIVATDVEMFEGEEMDRASEEMESNVANSIGIYVASFMADKQ